MTTVVIDPNLDKLNGHHYLYDRSFLDAAGGGVILSNSAFDPSVDSDVIPTFSCTCYQRYAAGWDADLQDFLKGNEDIYLQLSRLNHSLFTPETTVIFPTVTENHLLGIVSWCKTFDVSAAPRFIICLMLPAGVSSNSAGEPTYSDRAKYYRAAFRKAFEGGAPIEFFGSSPEHAEHFSQLAGRSLQSHPVIGAVSGSAPGDADSGPTGILMYAGDAKANKGILSIPGAVEILCEQFPEENFFAHANSEFAWGEVKAAAEQLGRLASKYPNFSFQDGYLDKASYDQMYFAADIVCTAYDRTEYKYKSSGVIWDAISSGKIVVTPNATWSERELKRYDAGFVAYRGSDSKALSKGVAKAIAQRKKLSGRVNLARDLFRQVNAPQQLQTMLTGAVNRLDKQREKLSEIISERGLVHGFEGWYPLEQFEGQKLRWTKSQFEVVLDVVEPGGVAIRLGGLRGDEAVLSSVRAKYEENEVPINWRLRPDGSWVLSADLFASRPGCTSVIFSISTTTPVANDDRDLGLLATGLAIDHGVLAQASGDEENETYLDVYFSSSSSCEQNPDPSVPRAPVGQFSLARIDVPVGFKASELVVETTFKSFARSQATLFINGSRLSLSGVPHRPGAFAAKLASNVVGAHPQVLEFWLDLGAEVAERLPTLITAKLLRG